MPLPANLCTQLRNGARARLKHICLINTIQNRAILSILLQHGFLTSLSFGTIEQVADPAAFKQAGLSSQRIWAEMKYRDNRPVLGDIQLVSKPSKRLVVSHPELLRLATGRRAQFVKPLRLGEVAVIKSRLKGQEVYMDATQAIRAQLGGEVICRVGPE